MLSMAAVRLAAIDARQSAGRPNGGFAGGSPEREISHARQSLEVNVIDRPNAMHQCVQQAPRMRGRAVSNSRQRSASGRRSISAIGAKVRKIARSPRSGRLMPSSMPFSRIGRDASNSTTAKLPPVASRQRASVSNDASRRDFRMRADNFIGQLAERMSRSPKSLKNWMLQRPEQSRSET